MSCTERHQGQWVHLREIKLPGYNGLSQVSWILVVRCESRVYWEKTPSWKDCLLKRLLTACMRQLLSRAKP